MLVWKLALRNVRRNLRRSIITGSAIALGLGLLMFSSGATDGMTNTMIEKGVGASAGHVVIQAVGWQEERALDAVVPDSPAVAARLEQTLPEATVVKRLFLDALLTSPQSATGVTVVAVEPELEQRVSELPGRVVAGRYLDGDPAGIVVGRALAKNLAVDLGDKVVLMVQRGSEVQSQLFRIKGLLATGVEELDSACAQIELGAGQKLAGLGSDVHQISAHLPSARDTAAAAERVQVAFAGASLDVMPWQRALPELANYVANEQGEIYVMYAVIFFLVALGIVNTVLMSVFERVREFGVMLSLGATPGRLARLILAESALLGLFAALAGVGLGLLFNWPLWAGGIDLAELYGGSVEVAGLALDMVVHGDLSPLKTAIYALAVWLLTVATAIYPAYKAATLRPVACLQHR
ncbi:MAG: ABC transporter permease [Deltaproteobacteria bacterium]|nr:ABC transporter permease [Deltaproteobacteria bacterium]